MSFFYPNKDKFTDGNISYNYPLTSIYKRDVEEKKTYSETMKKPNSYVDIEGYLIVIDINFGTEISLRREVFPEKTGNIRKIPENFLLPQTFEGVFDCFLPYQI